MHAAEHELWISAAVNPVARRVADAYGRAVSTLFHVTSVRNRSSIQSHGLDTSRMGAAPGIASSSRPEADGIFLCDEAFTVDFFVRMNNTGGSVDVWQVDGVDADQLVDNGNGFFTYPDGSRSSESPSCNRIWPEATSNASIALLCGMRAKSP